MHSISVIILVLMKERTPITDYHSFSPETVEAVAGMYEQIDRYEAHDSSDYGEFLDSFGANKTKKLIGSEHAFNPIEVLDIRPDEHDPEEAMIVHLPMANPLDSNMRFHVASIAATHPDSRVIALANPSGPGRKYGSLSRNQRQRLAAGDASPLGESFAYYVEREGILRTREYGYSYGADKALGSIVLDACDVEKMLLLEPASIKKRSLGALAVAFMSTDKAMQGYIEASGSKIYEDARKDAIGIAGYGIGLARPSNLAIARTLASGGFIARYTDAMLRQPDMKTTVSWGTDSELAEHDKMQGFVVAAKRSFGAERVKDIQLEGQKHALANHIGLQAALTYEALRVQD